MAGASACHADTATIACSNRSIRTYGFIIQAGKWADCDAVFARILAREGNSTFPCNPRTEGESTIWDAPKRLDGLLLNNLHLRAYVSPCASETRFTHMSVQYENTQNLSRKTAEQAAKTLRLIDHQLEKAKAREASDILMAVGRALGIMFYPSIRPDENGGRHRPSRRLYSDESWHFSPLADARDEFRTQLAAIERQPSSSR